MQGASGRVSIAANRSSNISSSSSTTTTTTSTKQQTELKRACVTTNAARRALSLTPPAETDAADAADARDEGGEAGDFVLHLDGEGEGVLELQRGKADEQQQGKTGEGGGPARLPTEQCRHRERVPPQLPPLQQAATPPPHNSSFYSLL